MQTLPAKRLCILCALLLEVAPTSFAPAVTYLQFPIHVCLYAKHDDERVLPSSVSPSVEKEHFLPKPWTLTYMCDLDLDLDKIKITIVPNICHLVREISPDHDIDTHRHTQTNRPTTVGLLHYTDYKIVGKFNVKFVYFCCSTSAGRKARYYCTVLYLVVIHRVTRHERYWTVVYSLHYLYCIVHLN